MKVKKLSVFIGLVIFIFAALTSSCILLSLSETGGFYDEDYENSVARKEISVITLNRWLKGYELRLNSPTSLSGKQLMEVTKLCIKSGDLNNLYIIDENSVLSFATMQVKFIMDGQPFYCQFEYSISNSGNFTFKPIKVMDAVTDNPYKKSIYASDEKNIKRYFIDLLEQTFKNIKNSVINRSKDFT
ncbi:hypothetical protein [Treponema phagedenis]|uniref:hypothetical protein n=1 Tax=Treponema phagedenis TaxID=162 RepID=UPI0001F637B9|nr:hypothetical protein [Treponema phagedenis]EFW36866.1 hypothetical protein HMPREF9554_02659 [Treponema phagedenis F0421]TYT78852.1 hypothetical protein FS559_06850 [Treponema phagedenis]